MYNIVILGDYSIGKSSIIERIINNTFYEDSQSTIGTSYYSKNIYIDKLKKNIKLSIWDTAGQERFRSFITFYLKKAHIIFLCYDITNLDSFNSLNEWKKLIDKHVLVDYIGILIGTKSDLKNRMISYDNGNNYAISNGFYFYETSSKLNKNIETLMEFTIDTFKKKNINMIKEDIKNIEKNIKLKKKYINYLNNC